MTVSTQEVYTSTTEDYYSDEGIIPMTPGVQIPSAIGLSLLILVGVSGNVLTVIAYFKDRHKTTVYDLFIVNLAFTDLILCCVSMPFYAVYTLMEFTWPFGYSFCKIWLVFDFTLCFETILLMLILSLDRLLMISMGPVYMQKVTRTVASMEIISSWLISFLVYGPAIIGWNHWVGDSTVEYMDCDVEFAYDHVFTSATAIAEFILPFVCLTLLNGILYFKIRKRVKVVPACELQSVSRTFSNPAGNNGVNDIEAGMSRPNSINNSSRNESTIDRLNYAGNNDAEVQTNQLKLKQSNKQRLYSRKSEIGVSGSRTNGHLKAAKLLSILVVAFLIFWAPYTITTMTISFCNNCVNTSLYEFFNWLLWMKSAVNPFLYAFHSLRYRNFVLKYLTLNGRLFKRDT